MKGSEFVAAFRGKPFTAWESAAVSMARRGDVLAWPLLPVTFTDGVRTCVLRVACDYFAVGEPSDYLRLPLTPLRAQQIADSFGFLLPTKKIATELWRQAPVKATPQPQGQNLGANLDQYAAEDRATETNLASIHARGIVAGHRKDIVVGKLVRPGKVVIWGWFWPDDPTIHGPYLTADLRASQPIQPYSDAHGDFYVDYSHGVRFVEGVCKLDGVTRATQDVLADPSLASLLSDEGALLPAQIRYPAGPVVRADVPWGILPEGDRTNAADRGLDRVRRDVIERTEKTSS